MKFLLACLLGLASIAAAVLLAERDRLGRGLDQERARLAQAEAVARGLEERLGAAHRELERLAQEIQSGQDQEQARERFLDELERRLGRPRDPASRPAPTPEELAHGRAMLALAGSLNRLLSASGHGRVRFFAIDRIEGSALVDVALHHLGPDGLVAHAVRAERLYLVLDPAAAELRLTSPRGRELLEGTWVEFGPEGWELRLQGVEPGPWRGFALAPVEILPEPPAPLPQSRPLLDRAERRAWLQRFAMLLKGEAGFTRRLYRVDALENLDVEGFLGVTVLGYAPTGLLAERFQAGRMRVERSAEGGVRLLLQDGFHEDEKGRRPLPEAGYLLFFPGADAALWAEALGRRLEPGAVKKP